MRPLASFLNNNPWVSLFVTPALLTVVPGAVLWWWPGAAPEWAVPVAGIIGVLANLIVAALIGLARKYFRSRNSAPVLESPNHASDDEIASTNRRSMIQVINVINSGAGIAALITAVWVVLFLFVPQVLDWLTGADVSNNVSQQARSDSPMVMPTVIPTATPTAFPKPASSLSSDELIAAVRSASTTTGQNAASLKAAEILVNRGEYDNAIRAALISASYEAESQVLSFVARSATDEGKFIIALDAASKIKHPSTQDSVELEVLQAIKVVVMRLSISNEVLPHGEDLQLPSFSRMLKTAMSGGTYQGEDRLLLKIAEIEVIQHRFYNAIEAASKIQHPDSQSDALTFVARCAVEEGLFNYAEQSAQKIDKAVDEDKLITEVLTAIMGAETESFSPIIDPPSTSCR